MANLINATTPVQRVLVVVCCVGIILGVIYLASTKEKETMALAETELGTRAATPPIDAAAPTRTETATFALG
jgi:hypothetical protein